MKEEALKLAVWLENMSKLGWADNFGQKLDEISAMIRRLVEELDKPHPKCDKACMYLCQTKPLSDDEIKELIVNKVTDYQLCRTIEERHGIK